MYGLGNWMELVDSWSSFLFSSLFLHSHKQSLQDAWLRGNLLVLSSALQTWFPGCVGSQQLPSNMWWDSPLLSSQLCNTLPWNYCLAGFSQELAMNFLRNGLPWDWLVVSFIFKCFPPNQMGWLPNDFHCVAPQPGKLGCSKACKKIGPQLPSSFAASWPMSSSTWPKWNGPAHGRNSAVHCLGSKL